MARSTIAEIDSTSSLTRLSAKKAAIDAQIAELKKSQADINDRLLRQLRRHGEADADGTIRAETDTHTLVLVEAENVCWTAASLALAGVSPITIQKARKVTPYAYVRQTAKTVDLRAAVDTARRRAKG